MATEGEPIQFKRGFEAGILAMEKELASESTAEAAMQPFGWGHKDKRSIITLKAILKEAAHAAAEKARSESGKK